MAAPLTNVPFKNRNFPTSASIKSSAIGLTLPISNDVMGTYFGQTYTTIDQAKSNLKNLLLTVPGERIMHPTLGTDLYKILFDPVSDEDVLKETVSNLIEDAVQLWLSYIAINELNVSFDRNESIVNIDITFSLKNDPTIQDILYISVSTGDL
jgi:phage baseplate assembly protein W